MDMFKTMVLLGTSAFALSACGGGGSSGPIASGDVHNALDAGSVARALDDGKVFAAKHSSAVQIDWNASESSASASTFSLRKTDDGHLAFTVDGTEHILTAADYQPDWGYEIQDGANSYWVSLGSYDGDMTEDLDPSDQGYVQVYHWYVDAEGTGIAYRGESVIGTETDPAQMGLLTSANYRGWMNLEFAPATGYSGSDSEVRVRGDMELTADFAGSTISGSSVPGELMIRDQGAPEESMDGVFTYATSMIDGNSYGGAVSVDADFLTSTGVGDVTGDYEGSFYGPFADEAAGTISGTTVGGYNLYGQFNANWQN